MTNLRQTLLIIIFAVVCCLLFLLGCDKSGPDYTSDTHRLDINQLSREIPSLRVYRAAGEIETISLLQASHWHLYHERRQAEPARPVTDQSGSSVQKEKNIDPQPRREGLSTGVLIGYQAIRYAVDRLFGDEVPCDTDFTIQVKGPMQGTWNVLELYLGKELQHLPPAGPFRAEDFTFTAQRLSTQTSIVFALRPGLVPKEFFQLKNQGRTSRDPDLRKLKRQITGVILTKEPDDCFQLCKNRPTIINQR